MRPPKLTDESLLFALRQGPAHTASELAARLGVSQPTVSRRLARLGGSVLRLGRARASRYAIVRAIGPWGSRWPLYRLDSRGRAHSLGELCALPAGAWYFDSTEPRPALMHGEFQSGLYPDLPWFLEDLRPQGFLGRAFVVAHAASLDVPADLSVWSSDHVLAALVNHGENLPGDLVLGDVALQAALRDVARPAGLLAAGRAQAYPRLATQALRGEAAGSSAGGEQPKFTAQLQDEDGAMHSVVVKFSEPQDTPSAIRWADLLQCEHLAGVTLAEGGIPAAATEALEAQGRRFLQSTRFDRTPALGRRGYVSLRALDAAFLGKARAPWTHVAELLLAQGWIEAETAHVLSVAGLFGELIGNSDMHFGNVAFELTDHRPLRLLPIFDMLPMHYAPGTAGAIVERAFLPTPPLPRNLRAWIQAAGMAAVFWQRVASDGSISPGFAEIARSNGAAVDHLRDRFG